MNKTRTIKAGEITQTWHLLDVKGLRLGKVAAKCAALLIGKHKVAQANNLITGDKVVIINAAAIDFHPSKGTAKKYHRHSGYLGGLTTETLGELIKRKPTEVIENAIRGMLPKNKLGREMFTNLYVYADENHAHAGQNPIKIELK